MNRSFTALYSLLLACLLGGAAAHAAADDVRVATQETSPQVTLEQVVVGKLTFDVRTAGPKRGEPVILLHGFPETSFEWRHQLITLARAGYRVIAPDLRGYSRGARPADDAAYGLLTYVDDVSRLADAYGLGRFHLVGHDVGALVAWGTAQLSGLRLRSLTVLSVPHPGAFADQLSRPDSCQSKASAWYHDVVEPGAAARLLSGEIPLLNQVWAERGAEAEAAYRSVLGTPEKLDSALAIWRANFVNGQPQNAFPIPIAVPTLYVWGDQDPFNCGDGEPLTRALTWAPYQFVKLRGVGHWIPEDAAERFDALLLAHLRRHPR